MFKPPTQERIQEVLHAPFDVRTHTGYHKED